MVPSFGTAVSRNGGLSIHFGSIRKATTQMRREYSTEMLRTLLHGTFEEKLRISRSMAPEDKMLIGFRLFEMECDEIRASLRIEYPRKRAANRQVLA